MEKILNGVLYTYEKRDVKVGDKILDLNKDMAREADMADYDETGNVITSEQPIPTPTEADREDSFDGH